MKKTILLLSACWMMQAHAQQAPIPYHNTIAVDAGDSPDEIIRKAAHVVPTANQYAALRNEFIAFIHVGPNTFTRMEWGNGKEDPAIFDLKTLNTDQWCAAMKAAGMKMVIITVKHHDGFVLWQSRYTKHGIMSTGFRNGKGDVLRDLSASLKKYGLKLGIYLSPADLYQIENPEGLYGNLSKYTKRTIPRAVPGRPFANKTKFQFEVDDYNEYFLNQLFELLTEYGPVHEVWFDGAHPKTKGGQQYNYAAWKQLIHTLAPKAVIFGKEDIRWCGNESGRTRAEEWNVIPYTANPNTASHFPDLEADSLGQRSKLLSAKYLHYQQAETNTSIREGWFYRDDTRQKVRSTDDVFDIYERSVGGNSTFLLNIPPNREGRFSPADSIVLYETGRRIRETYGSSLFKSAKGPQAVLDNNPGTALQLKGKSGDFEITTPKPVTINRIVLQEAIQTRSERVEKHAVDAWIGGEWKEIAHSANIGYKRILRFPDVTASRFRVRIIESRLAPAISTISAHYYRSRPPQLAISQSADGMVTIAPLQPEFNWKPHGENATQNLSANFDIRYTTDGSAPNAQSRKYEGPFRMTAGEVKAISVQHQETSGVASQTIGLAKNAWKLVNASSERNTRPATAAFDANPKTFWQSGDGGAHSITIDLGTTHDLKGFAYTPQTLHAEGMMAKGRILVSADGQTWQPSETFEFGNLINDPTTRYHYFKNSVKTRFVKIEATETAAGSASVAIAEIGFFE
ncbi:alpha-L-fucosidase [Chitinophaga rhizosphaerae]|uniref:alpha-L-fucosidase n=1 Tax=Chitinophaga rhizosphaerae TaxID=1864947 RepID=UPI000F80EF8D|nr:alpha-L-fucosidase [Chitinophaga rhizosphaerae]